MTLITQGFGSVLLVTQGYSGGAAPVASPYPADPFSATASGRYDAFAATAAGQYDAFSATAAARVDPFAAAAALRTS